jgi:hypothetical protein
LSYSIFAIPATTLIIVPASNAHFKSKALALACADSRLKPWTPVGRRLGWADASDRSWPN